jgi:hypothetical protein
MCTQTSHKSKQHGMMGVQSVLQLNCPERKPSQDGRTPHGSRQRGPKLWAETNDNVEYMFQPQKLTIGTVNRIFVSRSLGQNFSARKYFKLILKLNVAVTYTFLNMQLACTHCVGVTFLTIWLCPTHACGLTNWLCQNPC